MMDAQSGLVASRLRSQDSGRLEARQLTYTVVGNVGSIRSLESIYE